MERKRLYDRIVEAAGPVPFAVRRAFASASDPESPEEEMWREALARHALDALGFTGKSGSETGGHDPVVRSARNWWRWYSDDVDAVCSLAGIPHEGLAAAILAVKPRYQEEHTEPEMRR